MRSIKLIALACATAFITMNLSNCKKSDDWKFAGEDSTGKTSVSLVKVENEHREGWTYKELAKPFKANDYGDTAYIEQIHFVVNCNEKLITAKDYVFKNHSDSVVFSRSAFPFRAVDISKGTEEDRIMRTICSI